MGLQILNFIRVREAIGMRLVLWSIELHRASLTKSHDKHVKMLIIFLLSIYKARRNDVKRDLCYVMSMKVKTILIYRDATKAPKATLSEKKGQPKFTRGASKRRGAHIASHALVVCCPTTRTKREVFINFSRVIKFSTTI